MCVGEPKQMFEVSCGSYGDWHFGIRVCVTCDIKQNSQKMSRRDTSHILTIARNFRELLGMD